MIVCFIQFGDFWATLDRLDKGGAETYHAQKYSLDYIRRLARPSQVVHIISLQAEKSYSVEYEPGLFLHSARYYEGERVRLLSLLRSINPTKIILRTPLVSVLLYAFLKQIKVLPLFADSFAGKKQTLFDALKYRVMVGLLNRKKIDYVSNHNLAACRDLMKIGVSPDKIVAWDWPHTRLPRDYQVKKLKEKSLYRLCFTGSIEPLKGVFDIVDAAASVPFMRRVHVDFIGGGALDALREKVAALGLEDRVTVHGLLGHETVLDMVQRADVVTVPSRHEYTEGLPGTIYEALCRRTPVILSDHPMFQDMFTDGCGVRFFPAGNCQAFGAVLEEVLTHKSDYDALSVRTEDAFSRIFCPNLWHQVIDSWLYEDQEGWLYERRLSKALEKKDLNEKEMILPLS